MYPIDLYIEFISHYLLACTMILLFFDFMLHRDFEKLERGKNVFGAYGNIRRVRGFGAQPKRLKFPAFRCKEQYLVATLIAFCMVFGTPCIFLKAFFHTSVAWLFYTVVKQVLDTIDEQRDNEEVWGIYYGWTKLIDIELLELHQMALSEELQSWKGAWLQVRQEELSFLDEEDDLEKVD